MSETPFDFDLVKAALSMSERNPTRPPDDGLRADPWEAGVRQAIEWLRADYEYGTGPDWREHGAEWITERLAEHRREATP